MIQSRESEMKNSILFLHAVSGCSTTSAFHGHGKAAFWKLFREKPTYFAALIKDFNEEYGECQNLVAVGEDFLLHLYKSPKKIKDLNQLRFRQFNVAAARSKSDVNLATIPPTRGAARHHICRVYHQVQAWRGNNLPMENWGWKLTNNYFEPITTYDPIAPDVLLNYVACNCSKGCTQA